MEAEKQCCMRTKTRTEDEYKKLINRLNRIEGQVRGVRGMVEKKRILHRYTYTGVGDKCGT